MAQQLSEFAWAWLVPCPPIDPQMTQFPEERERSLVATAEAQQQLPLNARFVSEACKQLLSLWKKERTASHTCCGGGVVPAGQASLNRDGYSQPAARRESFSPVAQLLGWLAQPVERKAAQQKRSTSCARRQSKV